jgi:hypothetical protein
MEPNTTEQNISAPVSPAPAVCSVCHQPVLPTYYFCPNCGAKLDAGPLSTSFMTQLGIYAFSIILPALLFMFISKWPGLKYAKSKDSKVRLVGLIAWILLIASTIFTFWYLITATQNLGKSISDSLNASMSNLGY